MWLESLALPEGRAFRTSGTLFETFVPQRQHPGLKPQGLWYADGYSWVDWMLGEMPEWAEDVKYVYELRLSPSVLRITSQKELLEFSARYKVRDSRYSFSQEVEWEEVAEEFSGIEIVPYQYGLRLSQEVFWYYGWDVASGCIWHPDGLEEMSIHAVQEQA